MDEWQVREIPEPSDPADFVINDLIAALREMTQQRDAVVERNETLMSRYGDCAADWLKEREEADRLSDENVQLKARVAELECLLVEHIRGA